MDKIFGSMGIKLPILSFPNVTVPDWVWILVVGVLIGAIVWRAIYHRLRARFVRTHLRRLLKGGVVKSIHFDGDTRKVSVVDNSGETVIPAKPYKGEAVPAKHFEGITNLELMSGALLLRKIPLVVFSSWLTKDGKREHWEVKPLPSSPVMTEVAQPPKKKGTEDRSKAVTVAAPSGSSRDQRPEQPASEAVH